MDVKAAQVDAFLAKPPETLRLALIYGPDTGLVRERAKRLAQTFVHDLSDPFRLVEMSGDQLSADPARLNDEAASIAFGGGRRVVGLHGLGVEMAEALAEYVHKRIRAELGFGHEDAREKDALLSQGYRGSRYSFGYPACPNLADQRKLLDLLGAGRIGLEMSDEDQLHPEQSTSAIVVHHPQAKYFSV